MAVWVRQLTGVEETDRRPLPLPEGMTDTEFLQVKWDSHQSKGWTVTPIVAGSFTATKLRHDSVPDDRLFWIE